MTYEISPTQLMILDEGAAVRLVVRADVGPGHRLRVRCGCEVRSVRVVSVEGGGGKPRKARVEVGDG